MNATQIVLMCACMAANKRAQFRIQSFSFFRINNSCIFGFVFFFEASADADAVFCRFVLSILSCLATIYNALLFRSQIHLSFDIHKLSSVSFICRTNFICELRTSKCANSIVLRRPKNNNKTFLFFSRIENLQKPKNV